MQKIVTSLWFDTQAEEAARFYISIFRDSRLGAITRYAVDGPGGKAGQVLTVEFNLGGQDFVALNGGPYFKFSEAISLTVNCRDQEEIDAMWARLSADGTGQCGWVKDKYGLSWQIVPVALRQMLQDGDPAKCRAVMAAVMTMKKLDIAALRAAYDGA